MALLNKSKIKGNSNNTTQIETQNNYYQTQLVKNEEYIPDEKAIKLLKETIEDEQNPTIIYVKTLSGRTIQCGSARFSVGSASQTEREMSYWEDALKKLEENDYITDVGYKGEVFKITKKGYEFYDNNMLKNKKKEENVQNIKLNDNHIEILKMLRENDYTLWDSQLEKIFKADIDKEIAFNELIEFGYIEIGSVISPYNGSDYILNPSKKKEILQILKENSKKDL